MTAIWIAGVVLLGLGALALAPVRVDAAYQDGVFTLTGRAGPVPVKLFPGKSSRKRGPGGRARWKRLLRRLPPPLVKLLAASGRRAAGRLLPQVRVERLRLRYTAAGPDPYRAAMAYGRAGLAMEGVARLVRGAELRAEVDFDRERPSLDGEIAVAARLGALFSAAVCFGIDFLRGYFRYKRERE